MKRSKSSHRWLNEHVNDPYVKEAQKDGLRSRAAYKLMEVQKKRNFIRNGHIVVELGAAPGGWTQVVRKWVGDNGALYALDILPMEPMAGVNIIQGDFTEEATLTILSEALQNRKVDVVLSDMAPNLSGIRSADQYKAMYLAELALEFALEHLNDKGRFFIKVFQGEGFEAYLKLLRAAFRHVSIEKPDASRQRSREIYLFASKAP
jgi:23S rRNA (uridine2552-2'-O)-methyltransferase